MAEFKNTNTILIQGWMINNLKLSGNELIVYALIYGFSQDGKSEFYGSLNYIKSALGCNSKQTVINLISKLELKGLVSKSKKTVKGVENNFYKAFVEGSPKSGLVQKVDKVVQKVDEGSPKSGLNNNNTYNNKNNNNFLLEKETKVKFSFKNSLINYGFKKNLVEDWLKVRKTKRATNTETAFKNFIAEIEKRECDKNQILELIVVKNWSGFKWSWVDKENNNQNNQNGTQQPKKYGRQTEDTVRANGETWDRVFRKLP